MEHYKAAVLVILVLAIVHANGWLMNHSEDKCRNHHVNRTMYPYTFGNTDLLCMLDKKGWRRKRAGAPSVYRFRPTHRFVYYRDYYIEYLGIQGVPHSDASYVETYPQPEDEDCNSRIDRRISGYGVLSIDCIKRCAEQFVNEREYGLTLSNCHDFANYISDILCHNNDCPCE